MQKGQLLTRPNSRLQEVSQGASQERKEEGAKSPESTHSETLSLASCWQAWKVSEYLPL